MTKPIVIVSIVILLGLGYFAWQSNQVSNVNNPETKPQSEVTNIVNDSSNNLDVKIDENKNKSEVKEEKEKDIISSKSNEIVNPITGETNPASYYDEVLADGYTYNNPKPIPESWIIEPAGDEYPATLDYEKMRATVSESYLLPGRISTMFSMVPEHMHGYTPRILFLRNENGFNSKKEFLTWLSEYTDSDIYFISQSKYNNRDGGKNWNIFMMEKNMDAIYDSYSEIKTDSMVSMRPWNQYLPQYRGTKELEDAIQSTMNAMKE